MPKIIVYLTEHVGLQIIPINLILQIIVSYLVAVNSSIAINAYTMSKKSRSASTIGAATGLFIACPTCAEHSYQYSLELQVELVYPYY